MASPLEALTADVTQLRDVLRELRSILVHAERWSDGQTPDGVVTSLDTALGIVNTLEQRVRLRAPEDVADSGTSGAREYVAPPIVDSIPGLVALLSPVGEVEYVNPQIVEYTGRTLEELKQWGTNDTVHPDDLPHVIDVFSRSIGSGSPYSILQRLRRWGGVYRWFQNDGFPVRDTDGTIVQWCVLLTDIDAQKQAEDALRVSERDLTLIINTIPALAWSARTDGSANFFNRHYLDFIGLSSEAADGWGWTAAVHPEDMASLAATWQRIMASGEAGEAEARLRRHDGHYRWFLFRANPLRNEAGAIVKWFGVNTDIDDRKRAEEALDKARSELTHVARVATVSTLTASVAHEVSQPLSGIMTNAGTCLRMLDASPPQIESARETARRIIRDGNRASEVIARLRALFAKREFALESLDLNDAVREVLALSLHDLQRHRVVLQADLADDLPPVTGDRIQLQQVVLNLLRNASDAMVDVHGRPRQLLIRTEHEGGERVRVTVRDSGIGINAEGSDQLFDAFYTTKGDGMGIGLSVSRSIVERHQGRLWAEPNDGPGATFAFSIPGSSVGRADTKVQ